LISAVPRSVFTQLYILGWEPYFRSRFRAWVGRVGHVIPVGPQTGLVTVLRTSAAVIRAGKSLLIFPEGERSIDGRLHPFKNGIGVLACELAVPVVPVRIEGSFQAWPPDAKRPQFHPIRVVFGQSILISSSMIAKWVSQGQNPHEAAANFIRDAVSGSL
jgi:long-chain acyl-CoA synthetase